MREVICVLLALAATATGAGATEQHVTFEPFGSVTLYQNAAQPAHVVLFVSGDGGWNQGVVDMARALASLDALVVGIDITHYLRAAAAEAGSCTYDAASFEALSQFIQKKLNFPTYRPPVLVGYSSGATLAYAVLVQAPPGTFAGAISLGFCPDLPLTKPPCRGSGLEHGPGPSGKGVIFHPAPQLEAPWIAFQGAIDQVCDPAQTAAFVAKVGSGRLVALPKVGHGFSVQANWMPQFKDAFRSLSADPATTHPATTGGVGDLPLVEVPGDGLGGDLMAVMLSGDGGWAGLDREVSTALANHGVPVVGWNCLQYFWTAHDPAAAAADLDRVLRHYLPAWHKRRVLLAGYSLGADVLPFLVNRLAEETKAQVAGVVLIGCSHTATFQFHLSDWLGGSGDKNAPQTAPEIRGLKVPRVLCLYGQDETDTVCRELEGTVTGIVLGGGHHLGGDYAAIAQRILDAFGATAVSGMPR